MVTLSAEYKVDQMARSKVLYLQDDAYSGILQRHRCQAVNHLITGDLYKLDPAIGDTSCAMRPPFILDMYQELQTHLIQHGELKFALAIVEEYSIAHKGDKEDTKVRTCADLENKSHPPEYDAFFTRLTTVLGVSNIKLLGLCYSLTVSNAFSQDEFATLFSYRASNIYRTSTKEAEDQKNPEFLVNRKPELRYELAKGCVAYFTDLVKAPLCRNSNGVIMGSKPERYRYVEEQLLQAVLWMRSCVVQQNPGKDDIELVAIYPQFRAVLMHEFNAGRPIIMTVRRIQINAIDAGGLTYSLADARVLYFEPEKDEGTYRLSQQPITPDSKKMPCLVFDCWSTYLAGADGTGLDSADNEQYFTTLSQCNPIWLILTYAAAHPPFTCNAMEQSPDYAPLYEAICEATGKTFDCSRKGCAGFNLKKHELMDERPSLFEEWQMATQLALDHQLEEAQLVPMGVRPGGCYTRIGRPIDLSVDHVRVLSFKQAQTHCEELKDRHVRAGQAIIGQFIVRMGGVGVSCFDKGYANGLSVLPNEKKRKRNYVDQHGGDTPFLTSFKPF